MNKPHVVHCWSILFRAVVVIGALACSLVHSFAIDIGPMVWTPRANWINVKSCQGLKAGPNAMGNGVADDTDALQGILTWVQSHGGYATIYFPPGTYKISNTLKIHDVAAVSILGCGSQTIISWAGPSGGAMFLPSATHHMRYIGLVWEGNNLASCAYEHASQASYETVIQHENESFRNFTAKATYSFLDPKGKVVTTPVPPTAAIISGFPTTSGGGLTGETMVYNCRFLNCTMGIVQAWDVGNNFMWHVDSCEFDGCDYGINFYMSGCNDVTNCHFEKSKIVDVMGGHSMHVMHCTSQGSGYFYGSYANCPLSADALEDCWVDGWTNPVGAIQFWIPGPNVIFDCTFTNPPPNAQPPINLKPLTNLDPQLMMSNNYEPGLAVDALVNHNVKSKITIVPPGLRGGVITSASQTFLQTSYPAESAHIIDVSQPPYSAVGNFKDDCAPAIQTAIAAAQTANNGSIVYLPHGIYKIGSTLNVPNGNYSLQGEGFSTQLCWIGPKDGTMIAVTNPQNMAVKLLRLTVLGGSNVAAIRETATTPGSVTFDEIHCGGYGPGNPGAGGNDPHEPGIVLSKLPAGSKVYLPHTDSPLTVQDCGGAQIFGKYLAIGIITVSGTAPKTGFLGACVVEGGQQDITGTNLIIKDNQDWVMSGYYSEQEGNDLSISGDAGQSPGRVTIQGFLSASGNNNGSGGATTSIKVDNYKGRLFYGSTMFGNYNGSLPAQVTQTGTNPIDLILNADTFSHAAPTIKTEAGGNLIGTLNVIDTPYPGVAMTDSPNPLTPASGLSIAQGLDHLRQLEAVDLSVQDGIVTDGPPVAQYAFENDVFDMTGNHNGENHGATFVVGVSGSAAQFNGKDAYVQIPTAVAADFSIAMWIRTTDTGTAGSWYAGKGLVDGETGKDTDDFGAALNDGKFSLGIGHPDTTLTSTASINNGAWHHVVATRNSATGAMQVFVDGVLDNSKTGPTGPRNASPNLRLGSLQTGAGTGFLDGTIDQVQIYDYVLTPTEVAYIYNHTRILIPPAASVSK